jgi:hypothetical protein
VGVAQEGQVGQRRDDEVVPVQQPEDHPAARPELLRGQPRDQHARQFLRIQARQMAAQVGAEALTKVRRAEHGDDRLGPRRWVLHHVLQQLHDVEDLDTAVAQALCGDVVLLLGPGDPGQPGEQQPVLGARREAEQFGARAMGKHCPQPPDLTIDAMNMAHDQPPSCAGTPWLDKPVAGSITASRAYYASRPSA